MHIFLSNGVFIRVLERLLKNFGIIKHSIYANSMQSLTFAVHKVTAGVVKLVDIPDLGSGAARHGGSSPSARTETSA